MTQQLPLEESARAQENDRDDGTREIAPDLAYRRIAIANVIFYGKPDAGDRNWVLIDTGVIGGKAFIKSAARARFGANARPCAIILTHGHFDHVGVLEDLVEEWDVPVYAHELEHPYLNGRAAYPPGDPSVGGGLMASLSSLYPTRPVDVSARLEALPSDGTVPHMPGWRWLHTPGHSPGHVSFWRRADQTLIAGDAFVTTASKFGLCDGGPEPRAAWSAALFHHRLGEGAHLGRDARGARPQPRRNWPRARHAGAGRCGGAQDPGHGIRRRRRAPAGALRRAPGPRRGRLGLPETLAGAP